LGELTIPVLGRADRTQLPGMLLVFKVHWARAVTGPQHWRGYEPSYAYPYHLKIVM